MAVGKRLTMVVTCDGKLGFDSRVGGQKQLPHQGKQGEGKGKVVDMCKEAWFYFEGLREEMHMSTLTKYSQYEPPQDNQFETSLTN